MITLDDPAVAAAADRLTYDRTIARRILHKASVDSVLVTDCVPVDDRRFVVAGVMPRANRGTAPYDDELCRYDLSLLIELIRQAGLAVTHLHLGSPPTDATLMHTLRMEVLDPLVVGPMTEPCTPVITVEVPEVRERRGVLLGGSAITTVFFDGAARVVATSDFGVATKSKYRAARAAAEAELDRSAAEPPPDVPLAAPARIGREDDFLTLVADPVPGGDGMLVDVLVDTTNPYFFDHPISHVPGIVTSEALRQAALVTVSVAHPALDASSALIRSIDATFEGFGEHDLRLQARVLTGSPERRDERVQVPVATSLVQAGSELAQADLVVDYPAP